MESRFIKTPSGKFHAMVAGTGQPVILVHGYSVEVNSWRTWEKNIKALAQNFRVFALDLLGYGESDKHDISRDTLFEAAALVELLDAEQLPSAHFIGLSWGGLIVQTIAIQAPERVDKMVLVDSAFDPSAEGREQLQTIDRPSLIIWDQDDAVIPVENANLLEAAIPHARLDILTRAQRDPDADPQETHWTQMTHSRVFNQLVTEFLLGKEKSRKDQAEEPIERNEDGTGAGITV